MGQARTILFFSTWLQVDPLDLSPANLSGRMREWADLLVTDLHQADSNTPPTAPVNITVEQAHALSFPGPPSTAADLATTLTTIFLSEPEARFLGIGLGDFFKALRVQLRPRTAAAEHELALMFRPALALVPSLQVRGNTVRMSNLPGPVFPSSWSLQAPPVPPDTANPSHPPHPASSPTPTPPNGARPVAPPWALPPSSSGTLAPQALRVPTLPVRPVLLRPGGHPRGPLGGPQRPALPSGSHNSPAGALSLGRRVPRPPWLLFDGQEDNLCAVHALNHILQAEFPWFSKADLLEGAELAHMADIIAAVAPLPVHNTPYGDFSSEAVGRALARRRFDWRGARLRFDALGAIDASAIVNGAFGRVETAAGLVPILGVFVHQGSHYTAMVRRNEHIYHVDSLLHVSGSGAFVFQVSDALFVQYVERFVGSTLQQDGGPRYNRPGMFSVFYTGIDPDAAPPALPPSSFSASSSSTSSSSSTPSLPTTAAPAAPRALSSSPLRWGSPGSPIGLRLPDAHDVAHVETEARGAGINTTREENQCLAAYLLSESPWLNLGAARDEQLFLALARHRFRRQNPSDEILSQFYAAILCCHLRCRTGRHGSGPALGPSVSRPALPCGAAPISCSP